MNEMTNDAAVAWLVTNGGESCEPWLVWELSEVNALPSSCIADPLYSATTVAELRAEVEAWQSQCEGLNESRREEMARADAAERRVAELRAALEGVMYWDNGKSEWAEARAALTKESP